MVSDNKINETTNSVMELTEECFSYVVSNVVPHVLVFLLDHRHIYSLPLIFEFLSWCQNSHILACISHLLPHKIGQALFFTWFVFLPSLLQKLVMQKHDIPAEVVYFNGQVCLVKCPFIIDSDILFTQTSVLLFENFSSTLSRLLSASNCLKSYSKSRTLFPRAFALVSCSSLEPNWAVGFHVDDGQCSCHCHQKTPFPSTYP